MSSVAQIVNRARMTSSFRLQAQTDPTRTAVLVARFERELIRRWRELAKQIEKYVGEDDTLNLKTNAFEFETKSQKVGAFIRWLRRMQDQGILDVREGSNIESASRNAWSNLYIKSAYQKGMARSAAQMRKGGLKVTDRWVEAGFFRPIHADAVGLIYTRTYSELAGITREMDTRISSRLAQGMAEGKAPNVIARELSKEVVELGKVRSRRLARTEIIRSHAEATLNTYEEADMEGVEIESEFTTAGDNKVCPRCQALEGKRYTISKARGIIPVHPNCRCAWLPVVGEGDRQKELL